MLPPGLLKIGKHRAQASSALILIGASLFAASSSLLPARALPWNVDPATQTSDSRFITGSFAIDDESAASPAMLSSNVSVDGFVFGANDAIISQTQGLGVTAVDWIDPSNNVLSFVFASPLTTQGGTVNLDSVVSTFTPFSSGTPLAISGSVSNPAGVPAPMAGMGVGAAFVSARHIRRRIRRVKSQRSGLI